ncbi:MAG TPA: STAS domain-containing protein, partial [Thermoanaerobaculia bacterium]|nr:STAS domain-containing protein [Thermoanaerobaculia bacterium]
GGVQILDLKGKITIGSGDVQLRDTINRLVEEGKKNILINMQEVTTIDSSGIGELVGCYTSVTNKGGKLKLLHLPPKITDVLTVTQLITVFDVYESESEALATYAA